MIKVEEFFSVSGWYSSEIVSKHLKSFEKYFFPFVLFSVLCLFSTSDFMNALFATAMLYPLLVFKSAYYAQVRIYRGWFYILCDAICLLSSYLISVKYLNSLEPFLIFSMLAALVCVPFYTISCFDSRSDNNGDSPSTVWGFLAKYNPLVGTNLFSCCVVTELDTLDLEFKVKNLNRKKGVSVTLVLTDSKSGKQHSIDFPPMEAELIVKSALATQMDNKAFWDKNDFGKEIKSVISTFRSEKNPRKMIRTMENIRARLNKGIKDTFGNKCGEELVKSVTGCGYRLIVPCDNIKIEPFLIEKMKGK
jgi:hypothetical protein